MKPPSKLQVPERLPAHESGVRSMVAEARGDAYVALGSLSEAQAVPDGVVILEGDDGGQIYVVARASSVRCSEDALRQLLADIDSQEWDDPESARVYFERRAVGQGVAGGMGGAVVGESIWVHARLDKEREGITEVLEGRRNRLRGAGG